MEAELHLELSADHALYGLPAVARARRYDRDDVLFEIDNGRVAEVHLIWRKGREPDARWPTTKIYESIAAWTEERMQPDHDEYTTAE
jgi:hypothetical protein